MRKASTVLSQSRGLKTPFPAPDLIPLPQINRELTLGLVQQTGALHYSGTPAERLAPALYVLLSASRR